MTFKPGWATYIAWPCQSINEKLLLKLSLFSLIQSSEDSPEKRFLKTLVLYVRSPRSALPIVRELKIDHREVAQWVNIFFLIYKQIKYLFCKHEG